MNIKKNNLYSKAEGIRELQPKIESTSDRKILEKKISKQLPATYYKEDGTKDLNSFFIIISGGVKREKQYFNSIKNNDLFPNIKIVFVAEDQETKEDGLSPIKMFHVSQQIKEYYIQINGDIITDRIFLVVDLDDFLSEILIIKTLCENENITLIISNPCFEMWLFYGYFSEKPSDFPQVEFLKRSQTLKSYLGNKVEGGISPNKEIYKINIAIQNSGANYSVDEKNIPDLFSTNMHILGEEIYPLIKEDLIKNQEEQEERKEKYRNNKQRNAK